MTVRLNMCANETHGRLKSRKLASSSQSVRLMRAVPTSDSSGPWSWSVSASDAARRYRAASSFKRFAYFGSTVTAADRAPL